MNLQFLKYFVTLAEYKNFTRAAEKNFVVQSTFSSGIKKLEQELDTQLFKRTKKSVELTREGEQLLPKAKKLLSLWNSIEAEFKTKKKKTLRIGLLEDIHHTDIVVPILKNFKEMYKLYHFELVKGKQEDLISKVKREELDVVFVEDESLDKKVFSKRFLYEEKLELMIPENHEFKSKKQIKLSELDNIPFIEHGNCVLNNEVNEAFEKKNLKINTVYHAQNSDMLTSLVEANLGCSLIAKPKKQNRSVLFIPISDEEFKREIFIVWKKENKSEELKCFLSV